MPPLARAFIRRKKWVAAFACLREAVEAGVPERDVADELRQVEGVLGVALTGWKATSARQPHLLAQPPTARARAPGASHVDMAGAQALQNARVFPFRRRSSMIATYAPMFLLLLVAAAVAGLFWGAATFLGRNKKPTPGRGVRSSAAARAPAAAT